MKSRKRRYAEQIQLRDGFYIEVCSKGMKKGVKIRSENEKIMEATASLYSGHKVVIVLGEYQNGVPFIRKAAS
ncbi:MAG TPA: hypothetical protein VET23_00295 [Chitinophagaceae bacterium]|nr:hypothetical protein [Chitinophagaceae bacterium]